jgi:hypothetical protein
MLHVFKHQNNFGSLVAIYHAGHQIVLASPYSDYYQCSPQYIHTKSVITVVSARSELLKQLHQEAIHVELGTGSKLPCGGIQSSSKAIQSLAMTVSESAG